MKPLSQASKTAIGGMCVALSVVLLIPTALQIFVYALPAFAGMLTLFCVIELGKGWAFGVYTASSVLSVLLVPNKEAVVLYVAFFGYYAILKAIFESKLPRAAEIPLKFLVFNVSVVLSYIVLVRLLGLPFLELMGIREDSWWAKYAVPVLLLLGNAVFFVLDLAMTRMAMFYLRVAQPFIRKRLRFK